MPKRCYFAPPGVSPQHSIMSKKPAPPAVRMHQLFEHRRFDDEGRGLDRVVTAIAFLATVALIILSPFS